MPKSKTKRRSKSASGYIGVSLTKSKRYQARLYFDGKQHNLGCFDTANEAAHAYDQAILKYNGPIRNLNFPPQTTNDEIQIKEEPKDDQISSNSQVVVGTCDRIVVDLWPMPATR